MKQYIDKEVIASEIESLKRTTFSNFDEGVNAAAQILLDFLDTLEVKDVDLDKEARHYLLHEHGKFFVGNTKDCIITTDKYIPATKEQRDLLFQKMKEAGYEWDAEKKELKKVENEIEVPFSVKDSELKEEIYYIPKGFYAEIDDDKVVIKKGKKPTAWSEEDEKNLTKAIWYVENPALNVVKDTMLSEWLKSIKGRVQPQKRWKPSEEQMDALEHFVRSIGESGYASPYDNNTKLIYSLLEQLKQL